MPPKDEQYQLGDDGFVVERVGAWAKRKHKLLTDYIQVSRYARAKYNRRGGAAYIDVFCGPGRLLIRDTTTAGMEPRIAPGNLYWTIACSIRSIRALIAAASG